MTPDSTLHNPDPAYLRGLIERAGISQREAARRLGITDRVMRCYLADRAAKSALVAPYLVQFGLEGLAQTPRDTGLAQPEEAVGFDEWFVTNYQGVFDLAIYESIKSIWTAANKPSRMPFALEKLAK